MFQALTCLMSEHDWRLVALAGLVCLLASLVATGLFPHARASQGRRRAAWLALAGSAIGFGIWATHFIAMLAHQPTALVRYTLLETVLSLVAAVILSVAGLAIATYAQSAHTAALGGAVIGAGIVCMHYLGMAALDLPGQLTWNTELVAASIVLGLGFAAAMALALRRESVVGTLGAGCLLGLATLSHHFTAMAAATVIPDPAAGSGAGFDSPTLALAVAAAAIAVLGMSLVAAVADRYVTAHSNQFAQARQVLLADTEEKLRERNNRLDAALNNMSQGLCMFDAEQRILLCNRRFLEMYRLSPDTVRPGCTLRELIRHRVDVGLLDADPDEYVQDVIAHVTSGEQSRFMVRTRDGRTVQSYNRSMAGGGWVTTHEDITERRKADDLLREQKLQLDAALNNMSQGLNMFDSKGRLLVCNERYRQMYGLTREDILPGRTIQDLIAARIAAGTFFLIDPAPYAANLIATAANQRTNTTMELPDGRVIAIVRQPMPDGNGWVVTHDDITEQRRAEEERDRSQAFASSVIENVPSTIMVKNAHDRRYVLVNRAGERYFGLPRSEIIGKTAAEVLPQIVADKVQTQEDLLTVIGEPQFYDEHPSAMNSGEQRIVVTTRVPIRGHDGAVQHLLTVVDDRTNRKRAEAKIAHMAHHDMLTGIPNRAAFNECLASTIGAAADNGTSFALLCLDIDGLKEINDVFGNEVGDDLLCDMSRRIQKSIGGAFIARVGGDEFAVIATDGTQPGAAEKMAERLIAAIADEFVIGGRRLHSAASIGISVYPANGDDATALLANANAALYRVKHEARGGYRFFEAGMDKRLRERRALQQDLQCAVERNEFVLHYQPQALIGGKVIGFEALLRWAHPTHGMISPADFIPLAEESGAITAMGEWVLREVCREAASWPVPLQIAINLSPVQFCNGNLPGLVHATLLETGLAPSRLELEITEGVLIGDFSRGLTILRQLKALGVRIAMDDFGTGYSSLSYLQSFPFDRIKIDRTFISNLEHNAQSATIVRAVIGLARGLALPVIAEGVETEAQLAFLAKESCDQVQGFLIGRPLPIADYAALTEKPAARQPSGTTGDTQRPLRTNRPPAA